MTLDEILAGLFPGGHAVARGPHGAIAGVATVEGYGEAAVVGIVDGTPLGVDGALTLAQSILDVVAKNQRRALVVLVDTSSQNMARRDELLGLNEYLAHLSKCLALAAMQGFPTIGVLYGHAAAGAFISTALSTQILVAVEGAYPSVMDLPSISRVTKLRLDELEAMAKTTPIFAPGLEPLFATGAIAEKWEASELAARLKALLQGHPEGFQDHRDEIGFARKGRALARDIAERVMREAETHG